MEKQKLEQLLLQVQKPGRYAGGEQGSVHKDRQAVDVRFAFCFPDTYEIGMSHLGMKILYALFNQREDIWCERVFAPWVDFEQVMRREQIPLFALESGDSVRDFDIIGFTLQYEMSYTNVLNMLDLAGIPLRSNERTGLKNLVVAGGPCACNPEPLADFIDLFFLGEGEEVDLELIDLYKKHRAMGSDKAAFLKEAAQIEGVYVPSLYSVDYHADGTVQSVTALSGAPEKVKRIMRDLDATFYPDDFVVPFTEIVHDRAVQEVFRGCIRGCRFCQAGFIYRPVREKSSDTVNRQARALCENTGYEEISLSSLSTSDYTELAELLDHLLDWTEKEKISMTLPSLRIDNFSPALLEKVQKIKKKSGLTFAPEAGTQRLRDVINKNITEQEILDACRIAFAGGYTQVKLYFMLGLPTETEDDLRGITELGQRIVNLYYENPNKPRGKSVTVSISVSSFVPKPFTPFQFEPQDTVEQIRAKQQLLLDSRTTKKISLSYHDAQLSFLEGVLARGDRRLGAVLAAAHAKGCRFDSWDECFSFERWMEAFHDCGLDPQFYANRRRDYAEILPWEHLDYAVSKAFLIREHRTALQGITTPNCRQKCAGCGANCYKVGVCFEGR